MSLQNLLKKDFAGTINRLEERVELSPAYLQELLNLKHCLLEAQQRFFELKQTHRSTFLKDLEDLILQLEREAFLDFWKQEKTHARVEHMLKTGKPLRN